MHGSCSLSFDHAESLLRRGESEWSVFCRDYLYGALARGVYFMEPFVNAYASVRRKMVNLERAYIHFRECLCKREAHWRKACPDPMLDVQYN